MKKLFPILCLLLAGWMANAQTTILKGQVIDETVRKGISFALVKINQYYTYADEKGYFEAEVPVAESFRLQASQLGFATNTVDRLVGDSSREILILLQPKPVILEEITVSEQPMHCHPQSDIFRDHVKQASQSRDIGDLFKDIPGFSVVKKGGFAMDPVFRSFKYEQLNVIFDGGIQTTHACPARMDPATTHVNPDQVQKIELIKGPFSVRYGASMGATINIVTETWDRESTGINGYVEGGFETNGNSKVTQFQIQSNKRLDLLLSGGWKEFGSYESGNGKEIPSSFLAYDYSFKAGFDPGSNQRLQLNWRQAANRDVLHAGLAMDTDTDDTYILSLDYSWKNISPAFHGLTAKAYGNRVDHVMSNHRRPTFQTTDAVSDVVADNFGGRVEATLMPGRKNLVHAGMDYRYLWRDGSRQRLVKRNMMTGEELPQPMAFDDPIWQNSTIHDAGVFLEARHYIDPKWTVMVGVRTDLVAVSSKDPAPDFEKLHGTISIENEWTLSATTSVNYLSNRGWNVQLALGRGVRTANMIERFINHFTVGIDPYEYVGNPNLRPEVNHQAEVSFGKKADRYHWSANIFYSDLTDFITAAVDPKLPRKYMGAPPFARRFVNIDQATQAGFELSGQISPWPRLTLNGSLSYTYAQNHDWDEPLAEIPPLEAVFGARYERDRWWVDARARLVDGQDRISPTFSESETPGFSVFDLRAGVEPFKGISLGMGILNILDRQYREHLNRAYRNMPEQGVIYEAGRNVTFFAKYRF